MVRSMLMLMLLAPLSSASMPMEPGDKELESVVTNVVAALLEHQHLAGQRIDDGVSAAWFDAYVDNMDPARLYFRAQDIKGFDALRLGLDDRLYGVTGTIIDPAFAVWDVYRARVQERMDYALSIVNDAPDYTVEETWEYDRKDASWANTEAEANQLWRLYVKEQRLRGVLWDMEDDDRIERLTERYESNQRAVAGSERMDVLERYLSALASVHDPHSQYFKPASRDNFDIDLSNSVEGIGAVLQTQREYTVVRELIAGGPAAMGKELQPDDKIIAVAQGAGEPVDIIDQRIDKVVKLIRGKKGTEVNLTIIPAGEDATNTQVISIIRDQVVLEKSAASDEIRTIETGKGTVRVGVIEVPTFYAPVAGYGGNGRVSEDVRAILESYEQADVDGVIIDLRQNSGGSLMEAISLTGLFIDKGPVVQVRGRRGYVDVHRDTHKGTAYAGPLLVLTSPFSASASEIFAAAIQDYDRGVVAGSKTTHGKGSVQSVHGLDRMVVGLIPGLIPGSSGMLKLTTQQFYRVNGSSTQSKGVAADVYIPSLYETIHTYESDLDNALAHNTVEPTRIHVSGEVGDAISALRSRSEARVASNTDLQEIVEANKRSEEQTEQTEVSLVLATRIAERHQRDATDAAGTQPDAGPDGDDDDADEPDEPQKDPSLDEALLIAGDLIELG
jgi:carboxyl-terminal processing protease